VQNERMNEALKCFLHEVSEVIVPSKAYRVSITEDKMRLARHHIALPRYLVTIFMDMTI